METFLTGLLIKSIRGYQAVSGGWRALFGWQSYCCYEPSCSAYMILCLRTFGLWKGLGRGIVRILSCHPFARGGWDPVAAPNSK